MCILGLPHYIIHILMLTNFIKIIYLYNYLYYSRLNFKINLDQSLFFIKRSSNVLKIMHLLL